MDAEGVAMLYKNIMVAYDGSEPSREALIVAKDLVGDDPEATVHVVGVIPIGGGMVDAASPIQPLTGTPQVMANAETFDIILQNAKHQTMKNISEDLKESFGDHKCNIQIDTVAAPKVSHGICDYADDHGIDMIIMGRRGLGGLRGMLGSVSYSVLHECDIPVITVK